MIATRVAPHGGVAAVAVLLNGARMRSIALLSLAVLSACASSNATPSRVEPESARISGTGIGTLTVTASGSENATTLAFPIEQAWAVMPAVYDSLAIPVTTIDPATHVIANAGFKLRRQLGKIPLSRYINCGTTQIGPNADAYDVYLIVQTQVRPDPAGTTTVATTIEAMARPITFSQDYSRCSSTGALEARIASVAKALLTH
jgi:hypothetical protein